ncbi:glycosyltransferase family 4 protein [[Eubacterium] cellulosolvens]
MRVGLIIYGNIEINTGGYFYDKKLVNYLHQRGDHTEIITLECGGYLQHLWDNFSKPFYHRLLKARLDILIEDELNHPSLFLLNKRICKHVSYPIVSIIHHLSCSAATAIYEKYFYRLIERKYLSTVDAFILNSYTNQEYIETFLKKDINSVVAYPGKDHFQPSISPRYISSRISQTKKLKILFLGNLLPHKGLHTLLQALARLKTREWKLDVVGNHTINPQYSRSINKLITNRHLQSQVAIRGFLPQKDVERYLLESNLLAIPSIYEGFGISYLEALGFGLPIIATTGGAAKEMVTHGNEGFLVSPGDHKTLSRYINLLIKDRDLLYRLSINAMNRYHSFPSWNESMRKVREFLTAMLN